MSDERDQHDDPCLHLRSERRPQCVPRLANPQLQRFHGGWRCSLLCFAGFRKGLLLSGVRLLLPVREFDQRRVHLLLG